MDMKISGSGSIPTGEYHDISISGSGQLHGFVRCKTLRISGACRGERVECDGCINVSGSCCLNGDVKAKSVSVSGAIVCKGELVANEEVNVSGVLKSLMDIHCGELSIFGGVESSGDIEAEEIKVRGRLDCKGLLNAENIDIKYSAGIKIGSIGGSNITIRRDTKKSFDLLNLFRSIPNKKVVVENGIEGDVIEIEGVVADRVSGRKIIVGDGCKIKLIQYTDEIDVSPKAKVDKIEKI